MMSALVMLMFPILAHAEFQRPSEVEPYIQRFDAAAVKHIGSAFGERMYGKVKFEFGVTHPGKDSRWYFLDNGRDGECISTNEYLGPFCHPTIIRLNASAWPKLDDLQKEQLVFHELAHCSLGQGHAFEEHHDGKYHIPLSLMWPDYIPNTYYLMFRDHYHQSIFRTLMVHMSKWEKEQYGNRARPMTASAPAPYFLHVKPQRVSREIVFTMSLRKKKGFWEGLWNAMRMF